MAYKVERCLLRYRLQKAGMTQRELSLKMGVPRQQINKYVRDERRMSIEIAKNIASILNCSIEDLYEWRIDAGDNE